MPVNFLGYSTSKKIMSFIHVLQYINIFFLLRISYKLLFNFSQRPLSKIYFEWISLEPFLWTKPPLVSSQICQDFFSKHIFKKSFDVRRLLKNKNNFHALNSIWKHGPLWHFHEIEKNRDVNYFVQVINQNTLDARSVPHALETLLSSKTLIRNIFEMFFFC